MTHPQAIERLKEIPNDLDIRGRLEAFEICIPDYKGKDRDIVMVKSALWQGQLRMDAETQKGNQAMAIDTAAASRALPAA
jgi:hypothetical protein